MSTFAQSQSRRKCYEAFKPVHGGGCIRHTNTRLFQPTKLGRPPQVVKTLSSRQIARITRALEEEVHIRITWRHSRNSRPVLHLPHLRYSVGKGFVANIHGNRQRGILSFLSKDIKCYIWSQSFVLMETYSKPPVTQNAPHTAWSRTFQPPKAYLFTTRQCPLLHRQNPRHPPHWCPTRTIRRLPITKPRSSRTLPRKAQCTTCSLVLLYLTQQLSLVCTCVLEKPYYW
jgi:hypothetical protein